jgi:hypothetical protein
LSKSLAQVTQPMPHSQSSLQLQCSISYRRFQQSNNVQSYLTALMSIPGILAEFCSFNDFFEKYKKAPNKACTGRWGTVRLFEYFSGFGFFLLPNRATPAPAPVTHTVRQKIRTESKTGTVQ